MLCVTFPLSIFYNDGDIPSSKLFPGITNDGAVMNGFSPKASLIDAQAVINAGFCPKFFKEGALLI